MVEIISAGEVAVVSRNLHKLYKSIVLAGGCFDVLHPGHVIFLEKAKQAGDCLIVFLESDEKIKALKGLNRPVHIQIDRAKVLSALASVDLVVLLPFFKDHHGYDQLIDKIRPDIIAATEKEVNIDHLERAAKLAGAKLKFVTKIIGNHSTSRILSHQDEN